jgi:integrase
MRTVSAMLRWAEDLELLEEAKLPRVKRTAPPVPPRERVLSDAEIRKVWLAADKLSPPDAAFVRLVILTVIRSSNASMAQASWLQGDTLHLPASVMKNGKAHHVPVPAWAAEMIAPRLAGGGRLANPVLREVRKLTGIKDMQWHDLRRSFATWCAKNGVAETHAEEALAHISHRTTLSKVYNKHDYEAESLKALQGWQAHVRTIVG